MFKKIKSLYQKIVNTVKLSVFKFNELITWLLSVFSSDLFLCLFVTIVFVAFEWYSAKFRCQYFLYLEQTYPWYSYSVLGKIYFYFFTSLWLYTMYKIIMSPPLER